MIKMFFGVLLLVVGLLQCSAGFGQARAPVLWEFKAAGASGNVQVISAIARLAPGWHLYSQFIEEGGPIPTKFEFQPGNYTIVGTPDEKGRPVKFYDDTYGMQITWYTDSVTFQHKIKPGARTVTVRGRVVYMTCNNQVCIPAEKAFTVALSP
jgi:thiol:disulfide interchange protein DsbD